MESVSLQTDAGLASDPAQPPGRRWQRSAAPTGRSWWSRIPLVVRRIIVLAGLVVIWGLYVNLKHVSPLVFASPQSAARAFIKGWSNGDLASSTATTMRVLVIGMAIGAGIGVLLTIWATATTLGKDFLMLFTAMINPLPSIAILPLAIIWFGLNNTALIFVIANAVVWPIAINVSNGFNTVNPTLLMAGRNLGLSGWRLVRHVLLPAALPDTMSGVKVGWAFAWRTVIAAELVFGTAGGAGGLGYYINTSQYFLNIPAVFAGLVTIALIGVVVEAGLRLIERYTVIRWGMKSAT
jgi:NitT/TauT family transport system permease protein